MSSIEYRNFQNTFRVLGKIGEGNTANVYLIEHKKTKKQYAHKLIRTKSFGQIIKCFNQIQVAIAMKSQLIVPILFYFGKQQRSNFRMDKTYELGIIMQKAIESLESQIISRQKTKSYFTNSQISQFIVNMVQFFAQLQIKGYMHRDIKTGNILRFIDKDSCKSLYKVSDFGFSVRNNEFSDVSIAGSLYYCSPRLKYKFENKHIKIAGNNYKDDVYSFGITVLEMAMLEPLNNIQLGIPGQLQLLKSRYSTKIVQLIELMLRYKQQQRPDFIELKIIVKDKLLQKKYKQIRKDQYEQGCSKFLNISTEVEEDDQQFNKDNDPHQNYQKTANKGTLNKNNLYKSNKIQQEKKIDNYLVLKQQKIPANQITPKQSNEHKPIFPQQLFNNIKTKKRNVQFTSFMENNQSKNQDLRINLKQQISSIEYMKNKDNEIIFIGTDNTVFLTFKDSLYKIDLINNLNCEITFLKYNEKLDEILIGSQHSKYLIGIKISNIINSIKNTKSVQGQTYTVLKIPQVLQKSYKIPLDGISAYCVYKIDDDPYERNNLIIIGGKNGMVFIDGFDKPFKLHDSHVIMIKQYNGILFTVDSNCVLKAHYIQKIFNYSQQQLGLKEIGSYQFKSFIVDFKIIPNEKQGYIENKFKIAAVRSNGYLEIINEKFEPVIMKRICHTSIISCLIKKDDKKVDGVNLLILGSNGMLKDDNGNNIKQIGTSAIQGSVITKKHQKVILLNKNNQIKITSNIEKLNF